MSAKFDFKSLTQGFTAEWPVRVNVPVNGGQVEVQEFTALFRTPTPEQAEQQLAIPDFLERGKLALEVGFIGLGKGEDSELTPELRQQLVGNEWTLTALMRAYGEFRNGSPAKN